VNPAPAKGLGIFCTKLFSAVKQSLDPGVFVSPEINRPELLYLPKCRQRHPTTGTPVSTRAISEFKEKAEGSK